MYMTQSEIVDRYVRRGTSITILAELNAVRADQIREILTDAGVELPEVKKAKQQRIEYCYDALDDIEQRIHELIQKEIAKCNKEIEEFEHKIRDNAIVYGGGGWCTQFEKAKKRREDFIEELQGLERAQGTAVILDEISIYSYSCPTCQIKVMLNGGYGETVTCPVCERRIYRANDGEVMKVARDSRQAKVNNHYIQLDSYGRFKD